tara:strand:+ start:6580 stop:6984 length:405 start_codon:yes stop_codon:yes gene_type:complete
MDVKSVNILGQKYKITTKSPKEIPPELLDQYYGWIDKENSSIWVKDSLNNEHKYRTLMHEMGHGVFYRNGINFSGLIPAELEEIIVETFSSMQYEFMRDFIKGVLKYEDNILRGKLLAFCSKKGGAGFNSKVDE